MADKPVNLTRNKSTSYAWLGLAYLFVPRTQMT